MELLPRRQREAGPIDLAISIEADGSGCPHRADGAIGGLDRSHWGRDSSASEKTEKNQTGLAHEEDIAASAETWQNKMVFAGNCPRCSFQPAQMNLVSPPRLWLQELWSELCAIVARPLPGLLLPTRGIAEVARALLDEALDEPRLQDATELELKRYLRAESGPSALGWLAAARRQSDDHDLGRDPARCYWEHNPNFDALRQRDGAGALTSREWDRAVPILRQRALPILRGYQLNDEDGDDVLMQSLAELLQARSEPAPMDGMRVFEELPRLFANMIDRRVISWLRKRSARKRQASNPDLTDSINDPDSTLGDRLTDGATLPSRDPVQHVQFHKIRQTCGAALSHFEWHLIEALFVEATHTRLELASDSWVLEQVNIGPDASESKRRRALNAIIEDALKRLGLALQEADF